MSAAPNDPKINKHVQALDKDSSDVRLDHLNVDVRLDNDQLSHQHKNNPIGTRRVSGKTKFPSGCDADWHKKLFNAGDKSTVGTMEYMANWAFGLQNLKDGAKQYHGQVDSVDGIHYEGFCQKIGDKKYVLFHCYPERKK